MNSYIQKLRSELDDIKKLMHEFLSNSEIKEFKNDPYSGLFFITPQYYWADANETAKRIQISLKPKYIKWYESFKLLLRNSADTLVSEVASHNDFVIKWIEKEHSDWLVPKSFIEAIEIFNEKINLFYDTLKFFESAHAKITIIVPDTNSIINFPDPVKYEDILNNNTYTVIYLPTVLSELDSLKTKSTNQQFQNKVKSCIKRLKGYRSQGDILSGVLYNKSIIIKMISTEPNFKESLKWLDPNNNDDRIIASALEIQITYPNSEVYIATGDINLQNKSTLANLQFIDLD